MLGNKADTAYIFACSINQRKATITLTDSRHKRMKIKVLKATLDTLRLNRVWTVDSVCTFFFDK